jgi:hypothetical protein
MGFRVNSKYCILGLTVNIGFRVNGKLGLTVNIGFRVKTVNNSNIFSAMASCFENASISA